MMSSLDLPSLSVTQPEDGTVVSLTDIFKAPILRMSAYSSAHVVLCW